MSEVDNLFRVPQMSSELVAALFNQDSEVGVDEFDASVDHAMQRIERSLEDEVVKTRIQYHIDSHHTETSCGHHDHHTTESNAGSMNSVEARLLQKSEPEAKTGRVESEQRVRPKPYYMTLKQYEVRIKKLLEKYPKLLKREIIGKTGEGREISVLKMTDQQVESDSAPKTHLFVSAGLHAREIANPSLMLDWVESKLQAYGNDPVVTAALQRSVVNLIPMLNMDGRAIIDEGYEEGREISQRKAVKDENGHSVDLNRNFEFMHHLSTGASTWPGSGTYKGRKPYSAPETKAMNTYFKGLLDAGADVRFSLDVHSYSELILRPWGHTRDRPTKDREYRKLSAKLASQSGYTPQPGVDLYPTIGTTENALGTHGIDHFTLETGRSFFQSQREYERVRTEVFPMLDQIYYNLEDIYGRALGPVLSQPMLDRETGVLAVKARTSPVYLAETDSSEALKLLPSIDQSEAMPAVTELEIKVGSLNDTSLFVSATGESSESTFHIALKDIPFPTDGLPLFIRAIDTEGNRSGWTAMN